MELLDGLANEQVPAAKAAVEQRRPAAAPAATGDGGDAGDEHSVGSADSDSEDDGNDDQGIEGDEREEMRLVEDGPGDDPWEMLEGLDDIPRQVRERIQGEPEPQYEDAMHARTRAANAGAHAGGS
jgi:hypothetical protein